MTSIHIPILTTDRLVLRAPCADDFPAFADLYADGEHGRFIGAPEQPELAWRRLAALIGHWQLRGFGMWAIENRESERFVGICGPYCPEGWPEREIGWTLTRDATGRGYATEAALVARDFAYRHLGWRTAISLIDPNNTPSRRLAERLGAVPEKEICFLDRAALVYRHPSLEALAASGAQTRFAGQDKPLTDQVKIGASSCP